MKLLKPIIICGVILVSGDCNLNKIKSHVSAEQSKLPNLNNSEKINTFDDLINAFDAAIIDSDPGKFYKEIEAKSTDK